MCQWPFCRLQKGGSLMWPSAFVGPFLFPLKVKFFILLAGTKERPARFTSTPSGMQTYVCNTDMLDLAAWVPVMCTCCCLTWQKTEHHTASPAVAGRVSEG